MAAMVLPAVLLAPTAAATSSGGEVQIDFTLHVGGSGPFVATSDSGFFDCSGTFADQFMGTLIDFTESHVIIEGEQREMLCDDWEGVLILEFDFTVDFPQAPACVQHSYVEWTVFGGTGAFTGWEGSGVFDADIVFTHDGESGCIGDEWSELWVGEISTPPAEPTSIGDCKKGGWESLTDAYGTPFKNQGDCVSYVATSGRNLADG